MYQSHPYLNNYHLVASMYLLTPSSAIKSFIYIIYILLADRQAHASTAALRIHGHEETIGLILCITVSELRGIRAQLHAVHIGICSLGDELAQRHHAHWVVASSSCCRSDIVLVPTTLEHSKQLSVDFQPYFPLTKHIRKTKSPKSPIPCIITSNSFRLQIHHVAAMFRNHCRIATETELQPYR